METGVTYAAPSRKLTQRLEQLAQLGGQASCPIAVCSLTTIACILRPMGSADDNADAPPARLQQTALGAPDSQPNPCTCPTLDLPVPTDGSAFSEVSTQTVRRVSQVPLSTWAAGRHTSVVAFGGPCLAPAAAAPAAVAPPREGAGAAPTQHVFDTTCTTTGAAALGLLLGLQGDSVLLEAIRVGLGAGLPSTSGVVATAGAAVTGQPLPKGYGAVAPGQTEMSSSAGSSLRPGRLALWCLELRRSCSGMGGAGGSSDVGQARAHDPHQDGRLARSPAAVRQGGSAGDNSAAAGLRHTTGRRASCRDKSSDRWSASGPMHVWRDLLADAMHEAVVDEVMQGCSGADARGAGWRSGQRAAPAAAVAAVAAASAALPSPPLVVEDEEEVLAALHAALSRSALWRRHRAGQEVQLCGGNDAAPGDHAAPRAATAPGGMEETTERGVQEEVEQLEGALFVRLGLPYGCANSGILGPQPGQGDRVGSGVAAEPELPSFVALDLVFVSQAGGGGPEGSGGSPAEAKSWFGGSGCGHGDGGGGDDGGGGGHRSPIAGAHVPSCLRTLLAELMVRQDDDTGVPRALACTLPRPHATAMKSPGGGSAHSGHGGGDWLLCRALAPLLGGNTSPHVLAVLADCRGTAATAVGAGGRSNLVPDGGGRGKGGGQELDVEFHKALELMAAAQCIRNLQVATDPPAPMGPSSSASTSSRVGPGQLHEPRNPLRQPPYQQQQHRSVAPGGGSAIARGSGSSAQSFSCGTCAGRGHGSQVAPPSCTVAQALVRMHRRQQEAACAARDQATLGLEATAAAAVAAAADVATAAGVATAADAVPSDSGVLDTNAPTGFPAGPTDPVSDHPQPGPDQAVRPAAPGPDGDGGRVQEGVSATVERSSIPPSLAAPLGCCHDVAQPDHAAADLEQAGQLPSSLARLQRRLAALQRAREAREGGAMLRARQQVPAGSPGKHHPGGAWAGQDERQGQAVGRLEAGGAGALVSVCGAAHMAADTETVGAKDAAGQWTFQQGREIAPDVGCDQDQQANPAPAGSWDQGAAAAGSAGGSSLDQLHQEGATQAPTACQESRMDRAEAGTANLTAGVTGPSECPVNGEAKSPPTSAFARADAGPPEVARPRAGPPEGSPAGAEASAAAAAEGRPSLPATTAHAVMARAEAEAAQAAAELARVRQHFDRLYCSLVPEPLRQQQQPHTQQKEHGQEGQGQVHGQGRYGPGGVTASVRQGSPAREVMGETDRLAGGLAMGGVTGSGGPWSGVRHWGLAQSRSLELDEPALQSARNSALEPGQGGEARGSLDASPMPTPLWDDGAYACPTGVPGSACRGAHGGGGLYGTLMAGHVAQSAAQVTYTRCGREGPWGGNLPHSGNAQNDSGMGALHVQAPADQVARERAPSDGGIAVGAEDRSATNAHTRSSDGGAVALARGAATSLPPQTLSQQGASSCDTSGSVNDAADPPKQGPASQPHAFTAPPPAAVRGPPDPPLMHSLPHSAPAPTASTAPAAANTASALATADSTPGAVLAGGAGGQRALLGVLQRAAAGSEALHGRMYELQLEVMELRAVMEVQEETQRAEVARLRRHLRRAAEAAAAAEDAVAATSASCGGGCVGSGVAGPALAATQALATAYEQHVEALQKQVSELTSANAQLALQHAQAELAALAAAAARRTKTSSGGGCGRSRSQDGRGMPRAGQEDRWRLGGSAGLWLSRGTGAGSGYRSAPGGWGEDPLSGAEGGGSGSGAESEGGSRERPLPLPSVRAVPVGTAVQAAGFDGGGIGCDGVAAGRGAGASLRRWERCRGELGVLRRALKEAGEREAALRGALAAAQRGERAARLAVRAAAGEPGRVGRLEQQVAGLQRELADARREAAKVEAARAEALRERDEAVGEAGGLRTQRDVLAAQVDELRRMAVSYAELAEQSNAWLRSGLGLGQGRGIVRTAEEGGGTGRTLLRLDR